ncbi:MAG: hypothetical protein HYV42_01615 [Candidatus Magasanikbacteria bacterium]|nr:hypothetical protein [Candidatus Magasanikbacteria bacterium]
MAMDYEAPIEVQVEAIKGKVAAAAARVKELGGWPPWVEESSLVERIPNQGDTNAPGFDAGTACALDLIVREKQKLAATLHGNYSPEAVQQVRDEAKALDPNSETTWWLAACSLCTEGNVDQKKFLQQISDFKTIAADPEKRRAAAQQELDNMSKRFHFDAAIDPEVPYGTEDGCIQGAYLKGYPFAVYYSKNDGIYFVGTYHPTLGLDDFQWSDEKDGQGREKSGPVFGSKQFVKCANLDELKAALVIIKPKFQAELKAAHDKE